MATQEIFKRYEMKYLLTETQHKLLLESLQPFVKKDDFDKYTICNIYFDTDNFRLIRDSIEKPIYKEKFRLRSYGVPKDQDLVFLELKKKYKGVVYKRRATMDHQNAMAYLGPRKKQEHPSQIMKEIDWFMNSNQPVPKVFIAYERCAYSGMEDSNLRITFDQNIRWRDYDLDLTLGDYGTPLLEKNLYLMEIKIPGTMPLWLAHILTDLDIHSSSFSKYGTCYTKNSVVEFESNKVEIELMNPITKEKTGGTHCA